LNNSDSSHHSESSFTRKFLFWLLALFLLESIFSGALRYGLANVHLSALIYIPKFLLLLAVVVVPLARGRLNISFFLISLALFGYMILGLVILPSQKQALFGIWILVPFLFGLLAGPLLIREPKELCGLIAFMFWVAWLGLIINTFVNYPWIGSSYHLAGVSLETSRQWYNSFSLSRLPGFSRASFTVASQLLMFGVFLVFSLRSNIVRVLTWMAAGLGILLTTAKGPFGAWLIISVYLVTQIWGLKQLWNVPLILVAVAVAALPVSSLLVHYSFYLGHLSGANPLSSFSDRLDWMWPESLKLISQPWQWFIGRGIGGIGIPQKFFSGRHFMPADNFFVYLCVDFGLLGAVGFFTICVWAALRHHRSALTLIGSGFATILAVLAYGGVVNVVEDSMLMLFIAFQIAIAFDHEVSLSVICGFVQVK